LLPDLTDSRRKPVPKPAAQATSPDIPVALWIAPVVASGGFAACVLAYAIPGALLLLVFASVIVVPIASLAVIVLTAYLARVHWPAALALVGACVVLYLLVAVPRPPLGVAATTATWRQLLVMRHDLDEGAAAHNLGNKGSLVVMTLDGSGRVEWSCV
jgi:hypothetical protein